MRRVLNEQRGTAASGLLPSADHLERARGLASRFPEAGLREVTLVKAPGPRQAWLALECMQVTGSFKVRGALLAMEALRAPDVLAVSAGNHGIGVAFAAKALGTKATIVVPRGAPRTKIDKIKGYGATVIEAQSPGYDDAEREAIELARVRSLPFLSPYDDLDVLSGNGASLGFEIARKLGQAPSVVYAPIGGGGLATGLACALGSSEVWGVQSEASCAFAQSLERGSAVTTLPPAVTLAEGLEGGISARGFARARATLAGAVVVTEDEIANAMKVAYLELGLALEGSAAAALAVVLAPRDESASAEQAPPVVILTGRNVDPERLARIVC